MSSPTWDKVAPHRDLHLTSPVTTGPDVQHLQQAINDRLTWRGVAPLQIDGQFGPLTHQQTRVAAYDLGLEEYEANPHVQTMIEEPWKRTPAALSRAKTRTEAIAAAAVAHGAGLAALPKIAATFIGVTESPPGSNRGTPHPSEWEENFGMDGVSWCGCFSGSMVLLGGGHVTSRVAYCPYIRADAEAKANGFDAWTSDHAQAGPGWLVLYCWDGSGLPEHVGVVESIAADHLVAIEGNTSGTNPSDGGMVARMTRYYGDVVGFARPVLS